MKALITINDGANNSRTVSPLHINEITKSSDHGRRRRGYNSEKMYHPSINLYINKLPWYQRRMVRKKYPASWHYRKPYVEINCDNRFYDRMRMQFNNTTERDVYYAKVMKQWDEGMAKFHGSVVAKIAK
jgi:hypothetical protein